MHNAVSTAIFKISTKYPIVIFLFVFRRCRRGSNPQFQPYHQAAPTRLYWVIDPQRCLVIRPDTLSLFLLSAVEFLWVGVHHTHQAAGNKTHHSIPYSSILYLPPSRPTHRFFHNERYISSLRQGRQVKQHSITLVWVACSHSLIPETHLNPRHIGRQRLNSAIFTCVP